MLKNTANQKLDVYAYDTAAETAKTGDAANITAQISLDYGTSSPSNDANPAELDATNHPGVYVFDLTQAETNADVIAFTAKSTTANVQIRPVIITTVGVVQANLTQIGGDTQSATDLKDFVDAGYDPADHKATALIDAASSTAIRDAMKVAGTGLQVATGSLEDKLDKIQGTGFSTTTDSLKAIKTAASAIKTKTDTIGSVSLTVSNPTILNDELILYRKDDYSGARVATLTVPATLTHTDWTGATMTMRVATDSVHEAGDTLGAAIGTLTHNCTTAGGTINIALTSAETATLTGTDGQLNYVYHIYATTTGSKRETVGKGSLTVVSDV